jgi:putative ABC transport system ATP-binding protein
MGEMELEVLRGVSVEIGEGEFVALMGPSGSGKSTLMNILGCLDRPTEGEYELEGRQVQSLSDDELANVRNQKIGLVFQTFNLLPRATAEKNVEMPMLYAGVARRERKRRAHAALARVGLSDRMHHKPSQLSGGQQQRVAVARALANRPPIILADEPTGNLDSRSGAEIMSLFKDLHREGATILLITHDAGIAHQAQRILHIMDGQIVQEEGQ